MRDEPAAKRRRLDCSSSEGFGPASTCTSPLPEESLSQTTTSWNTLDGTPALLRENANDVDRALQLQAVEDAARCEAVPGLDHACHIQACALEDNTRSCLDACSIAGTDQITSDVRRGITEYPEVCFGMVRSLHLHWRTGAFINCTDAPA
jgi:hypothetical protein